MANDRLPYGLAELFPDGGAARSLDVALPPGRLVWPDAGYGSAAPLRPAYWLSDGPVDAELWTRARREHARSGLWPVLVDGLPGAPDRPWDVGEVAPQAVADVDAYDAAGFMAAHWDGPEEAGDVDPELLELLAPYGGDCPGLAPAGEPGLDPGQEADDWLEAFFDVRRGCCWRLRLVAPT